MDSLKYQRIFIFEFHIHKASQIMYIVQLTNLCLLEVICWIGSGHWKIRDLLNFIKNHHFQRGRIPGYHNQSENIDGKRILAVRKVCFLNQAPTMSFATLSQSSASGISFPFFSSGSEAVLSHVVSNFIKWNILIGRGHINFNFRLFLIFIGTIFPLLIQNVQMRYQIHGGPLGRKMKSCSAAGDFPKFWSPKLWLFLFSKNIFSSFLGAEYYFFISLGSLAKMVYLGRDFFLFSLRREIKHSGPTQEIP